MGYDLDKQYQKSKDHCNADSLSRLCPIEPELAECFTDALCDDGVDDYLMNLIENLPITAKTVAIETVKDPTITACCQHRRLEYSKRNL